MARIILVAFEGVQTLDAAGPAEVFAATSRELCELREVPNTPAYTVVLGSSRGESITTTAGFSIATTALARIRFQKEDTVIVAGGEAAAIRAAVGDAELVRLVARAAKVVRRIASVCSGAFVLAAAGVLDQKRAATHWSACAKLAAFRPSISVDKNAIYVRDGNVWTSAGVTTGIDMALAMVEEDHGRKVADAVASRLVLYARRPGFQSQFTDALVSQIDESDPLGAAVARARAHLRSLTVPTFAKMAGLSIRTLHRRCRESLQTTPRALVEKLRVEHARLLLSSTSRSQKTVAHACGFSSVAQMRSACERELGVAPSDVRKHFGARAA